MDDDDSDEVRISDSESQQMRNIAFPIEGDAVFAKVWGSQWIPAVLVDLFVELVEGEEEVIIFSSLNENIYIFTV